MGTIERLLVIALAAAAVLLPVRSARAEDPVPVPPPPWELTGTTTVVAPPEGAPVHRVDRRMFVKDSRFIVRSGFSYLSRGDFYSNPGIALDVAYYPSDVLGFDIVSGTAFFSTLVSTARALRETTGLLPDSQRPYARVTTGARLAFAYGKVLVEELDVVVHMDVSTAAHAGVMITDQAVNVAGDVGLAFQAAASKRILVWAEALYVMSYENRTASNFASGPMLTLGVGVTL